MKVLFMYSVVAGYYLFVAEPYSCNGIRACSSLQEPSRRLDLHNSHISALPSNVFDGLVDLVFLDLSYNNISILRPDVFNGLLSLTHINLSYNNISSLSYKAFRGLTNLTHLNLYRNNIGFLPQNVFKGLLNLVALDLHDNKIADLPYKVFDDVSSLTYLYLDLNNIPTIRSMVFKELSELTYLDLSENKITILNQNAFRGLSNLSTLYLDGNEVTNLQNNVFDELSSLDTLTLDRNKLASLPDNIFREVSKLTLLHLAYNNLVTFPSDVFNGLSELRYLYLNNNDITVLPHNVFGELPNLTYLDLSDNKIVIIPINLFMGLSKLIFLYMHHNKIDNLSYGVFSRMGVDGKRYNWDNKSTVESAPPNNIQNLDISYNRLTHLPRLPDNLSHLNIIGNNIDVTERMFEDLDNLKMLFTDIPFMCCVKPPSVDDNNCFKTKYPLWQCRIFPDRCKPENDAISSCFALIGSTLLRVCLWIIGMCSLIGNLAVIVYRLHIDKDNITKNYSLFTVNLAMSDLLMGVYLFIIGVIDVYYDGVYAWNNNRWRNSVLCTTAGILSSVSSEMSTFLILMVTIDRLIAIMFPLSRLSRWRNSQKLSFLVLVSLWIVSIILATIPIVASQSYFKGEFYSQSSVCLGLPLTAEQRPGTEYSFAVFVCLNSAVFTVIVVGQICIWKGMRESRRRISSSQNRERETAVARTLFFVVATDFCCWFPIGVMGVASMCGVEIPNGVYAWVMVFVLPINAAINPFLYTATAVWRKRQR
ncbi:G-protein coupled receptor GRL101-like, partial [Ylistrum balloti]|uniref:G-protein coupled receptor GRL101-like n=1 Tax=Ylistrum balloti TaxID=509963 RepID=UPI0029059096